MPALHSRRSSSGTTAGQNELPESYKWTALANTTAAVFMSQLDGSIVLIAMPAIFRGIHLDPLSSGNISYLLWMIMGYRLVQAVFVVTLGRLGDIFGRVKIYNAGFLVFTISSVLLSIDPYQGVHAAQWLIAWRLVQATGGAMLVANSAAILTDAFPADQRGFALGTNQVAGLAGMFIGLVAGGVLATLDWRAVFWVNVPVGIFGTLWAYLKLKDNGERHRTPIDWWGNVTFAVGLSAILIGITYGIQPYGGHAMGWTNPWVLTALIGGVLLLFAFVAIEKRVKFPMVELSLFKIRAVTAGNIANFSLALARGGLQFMLVIWLQGIWLPLHGYSYEQSPLWAGIYMLPMTIGFMVAGPIAGTASDRFGSRGIATAGAFLSAISFAGLMLLPVDFSYPVFAFLLVLVGTAMGMFISPNSSSIMGAVPARQRGVASGMRSTFLNGGTAISIGVFMTMLIAGISGALRTTLVNGVHAAGVPLELAHRVATVPPVSSLFASVLGVNPLEHVLKTTGILPTLSDSARAELTGHSYFPQLLAQPFHDGLTVVFGLSIGLSLIATFASMLRGPRTPSVVSSAPAQVDEAVAKVNA
jgi:MFS family permease